jgi:hypothetical protein
VSPTNPRRRLLLWPLALSIAFTNGCPPPIDDDDASLEPCDNDGRLEIRVQAVEDGQPVGFPVQVVAEVTDSDGVNTVSLYYRTEGLQGFTFDFMSNVDSGNEDIFVAEIPASVVQDPGVDFYVRATDRVSGCQEERFEPPSGEDAPAHFTTLLELQPLPFYETFETAAGCDASGTDVDELNWGSAIRSFPEGIHAWRLTDRNPLSGECAAFHSEGIPGGFWACPPPDGDGSIERDNWLISEPLDFSGKEEIAVRWFERHLTAGICAEVHSLYISTGSPNPDAGEYEVLVADLPFPDSAWESSEWYDLSAYAGQEQVYIALQYLGGAAGRWQIDDFYVGEPLADLELAAAGPLDASVAPGSSAVALGVSIINVSAEYDAPTLTATLTTADELIAITGSGNTFDAVPVGATVESNSVFLFDVDAGHAGNAYLDFAMLLDDGDGHTWTVPIRLLMGQESTVEITYTATLGAELELELGYGPPELPDFAVAATSSALLGAPWTFDVTEQAEALPPRPGQDRWYLRVTAGGFTASTVDSVVFTVGGVEYLAEDLPAVIDVDEEVVFLIPPPPVLVLDSLISDPDPAAPGASMSLTDLTIRNLSRATSGPVSCVMGSSSDDTSGFSSTPISFGTEIIETDGTAVADGAFEFDIDLGHTDNTPLPLTLLCLDGADTLTHTFDFEVPYAHPTVGEVRIDDELGDDDGFADPGEVVNIYLTALNDGASATSEAVTADITLGDGSTAGDVVVGVVALEFGDDPLEPGVPVESSNAISISIGPDNALGDSIVLDVVWTSGDDEWTEEVVIEVTGLPWIPCPEPPDPEGDLALPYDFDISGCAYRSDGIMLQVRADSYIPYDPNVVFVDFVFYEVPDQFTIESVGGVPTLEAGCVLQNDDLVPSEPIIILFEGNSVIARIALADLGPALGNNVQVALGAGSCPDVFFCDTYPPGALNFNVEAGTYNCDGSAFIPLNW